MIKNIYVEMLAIKIFSKEINPITNEVFNINDVKKEEYKVPILERIKILESEVITNETNLF